MPIYRNGSDRAKEVRLSSSIGRSHEADDLPPLKFDSGDEDDEVFREHYRRAALERAEYEEERKEQNKRIREMELAGIPVKKRPKITKKRVPKRDVEAHKAARRAILRMLGFGDMFDRLLEIEPLDEKDDDRTESESDVEVVQVKARQPFTSPKAQRCSTSPHPTWTRTQGNDETESEGEFIKAQAKRNVKVKQKPQEHAASNVSLMQDRSETSYQPVDYAGQLQGGQSSDAEVLEYDRWQAEEKVRSSAVPPPSTGVTVGESSDVEYLEFQAWKAEEAARSEKQEVHSISSVTRADGLSGDAELVPATRRNTSGAANVEEQSIEHGPAHSSCQPNDYRRPHFLVSDEQKATTPQLILNSLDKVCVPNPINWFLREYQRTGVRFLYECYRKKQGGILADDMGLGKTIQVIAFLTAIMRHTGYSVGDAKRRDKELKKRSLEDFNREVKSWPTALIVCPATLRQNWLNEFKKWSYLSVGLCGGGKKATKEVLQDFHNGRLDVLITGLEHVREHIRDFEGGKYDVVIVDEAHRIKNSDSALHKHLSRIDCPVRLALTGTPFMNKYVELWELLRWTNPEGFFDRKAWMIDVAAPIEEGQSTDATDLQVQGGKIIARRLVHRLLPPFMLRRTKELLVDVLPPKEDFVVVCAMSAEQHKFYKRVWAEPEIQAIIHANDPCPCGRRAYSADSKTTERLARRDCCDRIFFSELKRKGDDEENEDSSQPRRPPAWEKYDEMQKDNQVTGNRKHVVGLADFPLKYLSILSDIATHLALAFPDKRDQKSHEAADNERYDRQLDYLKRVYPDDWKIRLAQSDVGDRVEYSGKWRVLKELLRKWKSEDAKVLIFSRRIRVLDLIASYIEMEAYQYRRLDGSTPQAKRQPSVDEFNEDPNIFVFLISISAGGVGLNLTSANKVIIFDPSWTPALDMQAMDRAHRTGQKRKVEVYRLLSQGSLEERIYERQLYKTTHANIALEGRESNRMFQGHQADRGHQGELFGWKNIFDYQAGQRVGLITEEAKIIQELEGAKILEDKVGLQPSFEDEDNDVDRAWKQGMQDGADAPEDLKPGSTQLSISQKADIDSILSKSDIGLVQAPSEVTSGNKLSKEADDEKEELKTFGAYWIERAAREDKTKQKRPAKLVKQETQASIESFQQSFQDSFGGSSFVPTTKIAQQLVEAQKAERQVSKGKGRASSSRASTSSVKAQWPPPRRKK